MNLNSIGRGRRSRSSVWCEKISWKLPFLSTGSSWGGGGQKVDKNGRWTTFKKSKVPYYRDFLRVKMFKILIIILYHTKNIFQSLLALNGIFYPILRTLYTNGNTFWHYVALAHTHKRNPEVDKWWTTKFLEFCPPPYKKRHSNLVWMSYQN